MSAGAEAGPGTEPRRFRCGYCGSPTAMPPHYGYDETRYFPACCRACVDQWEPRPIGEATPAERAWLAEAGASSHWWDAAAGAAVRAAAGARLDEPGYELYHAELGALSQGYIGGETPEEIAEKALWLVPRDRLLRILAAGPAALVVAAARETERIRRLDAARSPAPPPPTTRPALSTFAGGDWLGRVFRATLQAALRSP
jgi:hypothetical protein